MLNGQQSTKQEVSSTEYKCTSYVGSVYVFVIAFVCGGVCVCVCVFGVVLTARSGDSLVAWVIAVWPPCHLPPSLRLQNSLSAVPWPG